MEDLFWDFFAHRQTELFFFYFYADLLGVRNQNETVIAWFYTGHSQERDYPPKNQLPKLIWSCLFKLETKDVKGVLHPSKGTYTPFATQCSVHSGSWHFLYPRSCSRVSRMERVPLNVRIWWTQSPEWQKQEIQISPWGNVPNLSLCVTKVYSQHICPICPEMLTFTPHDLTIERWHMWFLIKSENVCLLYCDLIYYVALVQET